MLDVGSGPATGLYLEEPMSAAEASAEELEIAEQALDAMPFSHEDLLYARVDLLPGPVVLEVELTEPSLFIGYDQRRPGRFADAIAAASQRRRMSAENGPIASQ